MANTMENLRENVLYQELRDAIDFPLPMRIAAAFFMAYEFPRGAEDTFWQIMEESAMFRNIPDPFKLTVRGYIREFERRSVSHRLAQIVRPIMLEILGIKS